MGCNFFVDLVRLNCLSLFKRLKIKQIRSTVCTQKLGDNSVKGPGNGGPNWGGPQNGVNTGTMNLSGPGTNPYNFQMGPANSTLVAFL